MIGPLGEYLRRYPQTYVEWTLNDHSPDFIPEGVDCAIHVGAVTDPSVVAVLLAEVPRSTVASPALLTSREPVRCLDDLARLPWLALNSFYRNEVVLTHVERGEQGRFDITPRLSTDSLYAVRKAALEGLGVAIVSSWLVRDDVADGALQTVLPASARRAAADLPAVSLRQLLSGSPAQVHGNDERSDAAHSRRAAAGGGLTPFSAAFLPSLWPRERSGKL